MSQKVFLEKYRYATKSASSVLISPFPNFTMSLESFSAFFHLFIVVILHVIQSRKKAGIPHHNQPSILVSSFFVVRQLSGSYVLFSCCRSTVRSHTSCFSVAGQPSGPYVRHSFGLDLSPSQKPDKSDARPSMH